MDLLRYMAPVAVILLVPTTLIMEPHALSAATTLAREDPNFIWILLCNSSLVYFVNLTNFQVLGNAKGTVAIVVSILIFRNPITFMAMLGYGITVAGVVLYGEAKKRSKRARPGELILFCFVTPVLWERLNSMFCICTSFAGARMCHNRIVVMG